MKILPSSVYPTHTNAPNSSEQRKTPVGAVRDYPDSVTSSADMTTNISQAARDRVRGSESYDFTNIAQNEILETVNGLIKSGQMSLDESSSLLAFVPRVELNAAMFGNGAPGATSQSVNLFTGLEKMIAYNKSIDNEAAVIYGQKALSALVRLQGTNRETE